ncbi:MAG: hypothetical protein GY953_15735 [bacterium]|nr:hypothetical protein [bacterium]
MDALALTTAPMLGADISRLPRNPDLRVRPGKMMLTRGRPSEIIEPVGFNAQGLALTFQQSGDLERMVQMGTGAMDSATPLSTARRNETVGGMSQMQSGFLKRAKRTMQNIERNFLDPLIRKSLWRYMQFDPERYPQDMKFIVHSTMGLMAKEVEQATLTQVLGFTPPDSPAHSIILSSILKNTTSSEAGDIKQAVDAMLAPPTPEQQQMQQAQQDMALEGAQEALNEQKLKNAKLQAEIRKIVAETEEIRTDTELADDKVEIDAANAAVNAENARNRQREVDVRRAAANRAGNNGPAS